MPIGRLIDIIKRYGGTWLWNKVTYYVRQGWTAFKRWWDSLNYWVRKGIEWAAGSSAWDIFKQIWDYLF